MSDRDQLYDVEVTVREHWTIRINAPSAAVAEAKVRTGQYDSDAATPHSDRKFTGVRAFRVTPLR